MKIKAYYRRLFMKMLARPRKIPGYWRLYSFTDRLTRDYPVVFKKKGSPPKTISLRITYRCNMRCVHCSLWGNEGYLSNVTSDHAGLNDELSASEWISFLRQVAPFRPFVYLNGGEPLIRDDISDIIRGASEQNLVTSLSTNAILLKEHAQGLLDSGLDYLYVSLDGPPGINEKSRVGNYSSEKVLENLKYFLDLRERSGSLSPMVEVRTTICKENENALYEMARYVDQEIRPEAFGLIGLHYTTRSQLESARGLYEKDLGISKRLFWEASVFDPSVMDTAILEKEMERIKRGTWGFKLHLYPPLDHRLFSWGTYFKYPDRDISQTDYCGAIYSISAIQPNGDVTTCPSNLDYITGNILKTPFLSIWRGDRHNHFRQIIEKHHPGTCRRCRGHFSFRNTKRLR